MFYTSLDAAPRQPTESMSGFVVSAPEEGDQGLSAEMSCGHAVKPESLTGWCRSLLDQVHVYLTTCFTDISSKHPLVGHQLHITVYFPLKPIEILSCFNQYWPFGVKILKSLVNPLYKLSSIHSTRIPLTVLFILVLFTYEAVTISCCQGNQINSISLLSPFRVSTNSSVLHWSRAPCRSVMQCGPTRRCVVWQCWPRRRCSTLKRTWPDWLLQNTANSKQWVGCEINFINIINTAYDGVSVIVLHCVSSLSTVSWV